MEHITSRKNRIITHLRSLTTDAAYRRDCGEFVCDGLTTLREALANGAVLTSVLWGDEARLSLPETVGQYTCPEDVMQCVSPLKNSKGPVFAVKIGEKHPFSPKSMIILEGVQDPGNVGTVIRTANAMNIDLVVLTGGCADLYNPKTVRSTMGAIFRQPVVETDLDGVKKLAVENGLKFYGAALSDTATDIRQTDLSHAAVAIGSEGGGLSDELISFCDGLIKIPMQPLSESLNAAVAASIAMWEKYRREGEARACQL
ncbi:MAG: RNA methyltransferase [Clostridia bacterium]|nr:RNA methyltransferase [Clostridia bacterium]